MTLDPDRLDDLIERFLTEGTLEPPADLSAEAGAQLAGMLDAAMLLQSVERPDVSAAVARRHQRLLQARADTLRRARPQPAAGDSPPVFLGSRPVGFWSRLSAWRLAPAPALVAASVTILVLLVGGMVGAAAASLPDSPLYSVKLAGERLQLALSLNQEARAQVYLLLAEHRLAEAERLAKEGGPGSDTQLLEILDAARENLTLALALAQQLHGPEAVALLTDLSGVVSWERALLEGLLPAAAVAEQPRIERAIGEARRDQEVVARTLRERVSEQIGRASCRERVYVLV